MFHAEWFAEIGLDSWAAALEICRAFESSTTVRDDE